MPDQNELGRERLLKLRPSIYLPKLGCVDAQGQPREDLSGNLATAACLNFEDAEVAPQELLTVYEAIKQCLAYSDADDPAQNLRQAVDEAFTVASSLLEKEINNAIVAWIREWLPHVNSENEVVAFRRHLTAVVEQYSLVMSIKHGA